MVVGKGRRKTGMELIENKAARLVCFSKRRAGLFKKARELSVLCGAKVGILVLSPAGKPMTLDLPTLEALAGNKLDGVVREEPTACLHGKRGDDPSDLPFPPRDPSDPLPLCVEDMLLEQQEPQIVSDGWFTEPTACFYGNNDPSDLNFTPREQSDPLPLCVEEMLLEQQIVSDGWLTEPAFKIQPEMVPVEDPPPPAFFNVTDDAAPFSGKLDPSPPAAGMDLCWDEWFEQIDASSEFDAFLEHQQCLFQVPAPTI